MSNVPYIVTPNAITVVVNNTPRVVSSTHMNYVRLRDALRAPSHDVDLISDLADIKRFVARISLGAVELGDSEVRWNGTPIKNVLADRLIALLKMSADITPLAKFLDRAMKNPSKVAQDELYLWLESGNQPITAEGKVLAFKHVGADYLDHHSHTMDNSVGQQPEMPREEVDPNRDHECSRGLHFCAFGYLHMYSHSHDGHTMIVEVDPADIVAIPRDYQNQKGRAWTYKVVGEVAMADAKTFFDNSPVVEVSNDTYEVEDDAAVRNFDDGDRVIFIGTNEEAYEWDLDDNEIYTVDEGTDAEGDVYIEGKGYVPSHLFEAHVEVPEAKAGKAELLFYSGGNSYLASTVLREVADLGQRGFSKLTGVPRTTIQGWLKAIANQG